MSGVMQGATIAGRFFTLLPRALTYVTAIGLIGEMVGLLRGRIVRERPTEVMRAVIAADIGMVGALVRDGSVDLTTINPQDNMTAFLYACRGGNVSIARLLYESAQPSPGDVQRALVLAANRGHQEMVTWLVSCCKAVLSLPDDSGKNALMSASEGGHCNIIRSCIDAGVSTTAVNKKNKNATALVYACANGHMDAVKLLVSVRMMEAQKGPEEKMVVVCEMGMAFARATLNRHTQIATWLTEYCDKNFAQEDQLLMTVWALRSPEQS
ncbi:MAG: ankyrin repeat domain-containing protein [Simkaniaceae bacterium]|nr:ankyrin repeat domain-containing protein [Simkaniaceae bacterium]